MWASLLVKSVQYSKVQESVGYVFFIGWAQLVQLHIVSILCILIQLPNVYATFVFHIILTLATSSIIQVISWAIVKHYEQYLKRLHRSFFRSLIAKKPTFNRSLVFGVSFTYISVVLYVAQPTAASISLGLMQTLLCYLIEDLYRYMKFHHHWFFRAVSRWWMLNWQKSNTTLSSPIEIQAGHFEPISSPESSDQSDSPNNPFSKCNEAEGPDSQSVEVLGDSKTHRVRPFPSAKHTWRHVKGAFKGWSTLQIGGKRLTSS